MASNGKDEVPDSGKKKKRNVMRCSDELELVKMILDDNAPLRERVLRLLERALKVEDEQNKRKT